MAPKLYYRPEIDGLRALAVIPVILFHAEYRLFGGGFIGVDVFFVISGYLITSIIIKDLERKTFTFAGFYERRARRILPALFFVMLCCIPFAWMWLTPLTLKSFGLSVVSVLAFASNMFFGRQTGYFEVDPSEVRVLLHTWSLSVEEQFYILFPLVLLILWRYGKRTVLVALFLIALCSLLLSEFLSRNYPIVNFYWAPSRAWELMAGALCAFAPIRSHSVRDNALSAIGLTTIIGSVFAFDSSTRFPSFYALLPIIGTTLVLLFGREGTLVARLLSLKPIVGVGFISYSAYLWHWPLFEFARFRSIPDASPLTIAVLILVTFAVSYLSWRFIELPFRRKSGAVSVSRKTLIASVISVGLVLGIFGITMHVLWGVPQRFNANVLAPLEKLGNNYGLDAECDGEFKLMDRCRTAPRPNLVIWGDSFAIHLVGAFKAANIPLIQMTQSNCAPLLSITASSNTSSVCKEFNSQVLDWLKKSDDIRYVVLSSPFESIVGADVLRNDDNQMVKGSPDVLAQALLATIEKLEGLGKKVVVFSPPPRARFSVGGCLFKAYFFAEDSAACNFTPEQWRAKTSLVFAALRNVETRAKVIWTGDFFCERDYRPCYASKDGVWIYRDTGHIGYEGAAWIGRSEKFSMALRSIGLLN